MKKQFKKMCVAYKFYDKQKRALELMLSDKIKFKFNIVNLGGDGFAILDVYSDNKDALPYVCDLKIAIDIINLKGYLESRDVREHSF